MLEEEKKIVNVQILNEVVSLMISDKDENLERYTFITAYKLQFKNSKFKKISPCRIDSKINGLYNRK